VWPDHGGCKSKNLAHRRGHHKRLTLRPEIEGDGTKRGSRERRAKGVVRRPPAPGNCVPSSRLKGVATLDVGMNGE